MRTNSKTRKTMPKEWQDFFKNFKGKYFKDGMECCVAEPERYQERGFVQTATQRTHIVARDWAERNGYKKEMEFMDVFFNKKNYLPGIVDICCTQHDSGIYIYDRLEMMQNGYLLEKQPGKRKNYLDEEMGENHYYRVPLHLCYKVTDLWDVPKKCNKRRLYQMAVWQYVHMTTKDKYDECMYDSINTWEDLPDWCFWKYMLPNGDVIEGREQAFEEYKNKIRSHANYVPTVRSMEESKND